MGTQLAPRPSASARWLILGGAVALLVAVVLFAAQAATVPVVVAEAPTAFQSIAPIWPLMGILLLGGTGLGAIALGRGKQHRDRLHAARLERMRRAMHDPADAGLSAGIARPPGPLGSA